MFGKDTPPSADGNKSLIRRLMIFIALVNVAEGLGQVGGIINQPLVFFLKEQLHWAPDQVTQYVALLIIPWIIKPIYGLLSDYLPVLGYHRKPYLILANMLTTGGFLWMSGMLAPAQILIALFLTAFGMAASSTITEAVMVENGNRLGTSGKFLNQQWIWFNIATIGTSLGAGWLAGHLSPASAFHTAALIACVAPLVVAALTWFLIDEKPGKITPPKEIGHELSSVFKSRLFWVTVIFLFVWNIVPSFGTPLFYHMVDGLKFTQGFIGMLNAIAAVGAVVGGLAYTWLSKRLSLKHLLYLSLAVTTVGQLLYVIMASPGSAIAIYFINGVFGMLALVSSLTVAAHATPAKSAGFVFALLMSVNNLSGQLSTNIGSWMFVHLFHNQLNPVIFIAAAATAACALLVPILRLGNQRGDEIMRLVKNRNANDEEIPRDIAKKVQKRLPNSSPNGQ